MKKNLSIVFATAILFTLFISSVLYPEGSPGAKTGSPLDASICSQCHISDVSEVSWITSNIPSEGWKPGETYTLTLTAAPDTASYIGFEVTAENESKKAGTFILTDVERTRFTNNDKAVTHTHDGTTPTKVISIWDVNWKAPEEDLGTISFYAAFNAADGDASTEGDHIYASAVSYEQSQNTAIVQINKPTLKIYPNPASNILFIQSQQPLIEVNLFDTNGKLVKSVSNINQLETHLAVQQMKRGLYILTVNTSNGEFTQRIQLN